MGTITYFPNPVAIQNLRYVFGTFVGTAVGTVATGLGTVQYAYANVRGANGTLAYAHATPSGANVVVTVYAPSGSATASGGTVDWMAVGL
jgi:hypothetical protein